MSIEAQVQVLTLEPNDSRRLAVLCGPLDQNLRQIEDRLGIHIRNRGNAFHLSGDDAPVQAAKALLSHLYKETQSDAPLMPDQIHLLLQQSGVEALLDDASQAENVPFIRTRRKVVKPRGPNQVHYTRSLERHDVSFAIGPAGTGKTYLAVACAIQALETERVARMVLVRPAVEAGEKLGFLPGDLAQKIDPYLRPLYDALYELMGFEKVHKLIERQIIEIAPLAYMRGRTLNNSFIILDEGQNTTVEQMKMFLTRLGLGSTAVITGDITQIDLARGTRSGLIHVIDVLRDVAGISFTRFTSKDVVRHPLVQSIVEAYDRDDLRSDGDD